MKATSQQADATKKQADATSKLVEMTARGLETQKPNIVINLFGGYCLYAKETTVLQPGIASSFTYGLPTIGPPPKVWVRCEPTDSDAILFARVVVHARNDSSIYDAIISARLMLDKTAGQPSARYGEERKGYPFLGSVVEAYKFIAVTLDFHFDKATYGKFIPWYFRPHTTYQVQYETSRGQSLQIEYKPHEFLQQQIQIGGSADVR